MPRFSDFVPIVMMDLFMYPYLLNVPEHLHILYNSLEEGVKAMEGHAEYIIKWRVVEDFLSDKSLRRSCMAKCLERSDERDLFEHYTTIHID